MMSMPQDPPHRREADPWPTLEAAIREVSTVAEHARAFYGEPAEERVAVRVAGSPGQRAGFGPRRVAGAGATGRSR